MKSIQLDGIEFSYNEERDYEKDGHVYCKTCHEQVDGTPLQTFGKAFIFRKECKCDRDRKAEEERQKRLMEQDILRKKCFISRNQIDYTFDNADEGLDKALIQSVRNYVEHFEDMRKDNIGLILYGGVGSGKTYLACCIANEIISKYLYNVKMRNFSQILNDLQHGGYDFDRNEYIDSITNATLLILDDFGIERNTEYALEQVYNVINARYLKAKPTIITTNLNYNDIDKDQENIMLGRIYSRIIEMCLPLRVTGMDRRKRKRKEKTKRAQDLLCK